jgi:hypothetical protein
MNIWLQVLQSLAIATFASSGKIEKYKNIFTLNVLKKILVICFTDSVGYLKPFVFAPK